MIMNTLLKWIVGIVIVVLIAWGGYVLYQKYSGSIDGGVATGEPIKIGFIGALTGDAAAYGEGARNTVALAVDEINKSGGVDGRPLEVVYEDGKCNGKDAANAAQKLVNVDKVMVIFGGSCSGETLSAIPIVEVGKVVLVSGTATSPDLTGKSKFFFRTYPSDAKQGEIVADAANAKGWKKVVAIQEQTDYALGYYKAFENRFKQLGGTVTKEEFATSVTDVRSLLTKLKNQKPDALLISVQTPAAGERILKQLQDLKWKPALIVIDILVNDTATVERNKEYLEGAIGADFALDQNNQKLQNFLAAYKAMFNADVPFTSYNTAVYDSVYVIKDGIMAVGLDGEKIADWSRTIKDWAGASGMITIDANGDRASAHSVKVVKDGKAQF